MNQSAGKLDSAAEFDKLAVSRYPWYKEHLNKHNVIHIVFNEMPKECKSYEHYINCIQESLFDDLAMAYPNVRIRETTGRILAVGIAYNKDDEKKRHECKVEVLREKLY